MEKIVGYCPMGCGETLFVGVGGYVTCSFIGCPNPAAVSDLLADGDTRHVVRVGEEHFTTSHPLRERLDGDLFACELHQRIAEEEGPPVEPGLYHCWMENGELQWAPKS